VDTNSQLKPVNGLYKYNIYPRSESFINSKGLDLSKFNFYKIAYVVHHIYAKKKPAYKAQLFQPATFFRMIKGGICIT
jgi:hypothetical protein